MEFDQLVSEYHFDENQIITSGMPRFHNRATEIQPKKLKRILYAPSWRRNLMIGQSHKGSGWQPNEGLLKKSIIMKSIEELYENDAFNSWLQTNGVEIDIKLHPIMNEFMSEGLEDNPSIKIVDEVTDMTEYDLFVTDYSSFMYDAVAANVPVLLYQPDYDYFVSGVHTFREYITPADRKLADQVFTFNEFVNKVRDMYENSELLNSHLPEYEGFLQVSANPMNTIYDEVSAENFGKMQQTVLRDYLNTDNLFHEFVEEEAYNNRLNFENQKLRIETVGLTEVYTSPDLLPRTKMLVNMAAGTEIDVYGMTNENGKLTLASELGFIDGTARTVKYFLEASDLMQQRLLETAKSSVAEMRDLFERLKKKKPAAVNGVIHKAIVQQGLPADIVMVNKDTKQQQAVVLNSLRWDIEGNVLLDVEGHDVLLPQDKYSYILFREDIENYITDVSELESLVALRTLAVYSSLDFNGKTKTDETVLPFTDVSDSKIMWTAHGTPRLAYKDGFISANRECVGTPSAMKFGALRMTKRWFLN
jgi:hypothetical protein